MSDAQTSRSAEFVAFYERNYTEAVRLAGFLSGDRALAEDLAQEAFLRLQPQFPEVENPAGYVRTTLVNLCHNHRRSAMRETARLTRHGAPATDVSERAGELDATR